MVSCFFRFYIKSQKDFYIGFARAENGFELFRQIDQYGDPHDVKVHQVGSGMSFCVRALHNEEKFAEEFSELEVDAGLFNSTLDSRWKSPKITEDFEMILPWVSCEEGRG